MKRTWMLPADLLNIHIYRRVNRLWLSTMWLILSLFAFFFSFFIYTLCQMDEHYSFPFCCLHAWSLNRHFAFLTGCRWLHSQPVNDEWKRQYLTYVECSLLMFNAMAYGSCLWQVQCEHLILPLRMHLKFSNIVDLFIVYLCNDCTAECI